MGVTVVTMDLGFVPFGREKTMRPQTEEDIFVQQMKILFGMKVDVFTDAVRRKPGAFNKILPSCKLVESKSLPWGKSSSVGFQNFMRRFFAPSPHSRPLAGSLARDPALPK